MNMLGFKNQITITNRITNDIMYINKDNLLYILCRDDVIHLELVGKSLVFDKDNYIITTH